MTTNATAQQTAPAPKPVHKCPRCGKRMAAPKPPRAVRPAVFRPVCDISGAWLAELLRHTLVATVPSKTGAVHYTGGVFLQLEPGKLTAVATDGFRMAIFECPAALRLRPASLLLDAAAVKGWPWLLEKRLRSAWLRIESDGKRLRLIEPGLLDETAQPPAECNLLDVKFPPFASVLRAPAETDWRFTASAAAWTELLDNALRDFNGNKAARSETVQLHLQLAAGGAQFTRQSEDKRSPAVPLPTPPSTAVGDAQVCFEPRYLLDSVRLLPGSASVELRGVTEESGDRAGLVIKPLFATCDLLPGWQLALMPVRMD